MTPKNILMIKSHSLGIGDILRSSAAWRALKNKWPEAHLHLLFLSKHAGYPSESFIKTHHLLSSAHFITVREQDPSVKKAKRIPAIQIIRQVQSIAKMIQPDLIIDFEPHGLKTSLMTYFASKSCNAETLGIAQFPGRSFFYNKTSNSVTNYALKNNMDMPMDYTHRDFVALQALGIQRKRISIELNLTDHAIDFKNSILEKLPKNILNIGLNIGCGTPDALIKRPDTNKLAECIASLYSKCKFNLILSGAYYEQDINQEFIDALKKISPNMPEVFDFAGKTSLLTTAGLIDACDLFISTDSGPYHMSVGLKKPTLVLFTYPERTSFHDELWVHRLIKPTVNDFVQSALDLLNI